MKRYILHVCSGVWLVVLGIVMLRTVLEALPSGALIMVNNSGKWEAVLDIFLLIVGIGLGMAELIVAIWTWRNE